MWLPPATGEGVAVGLFLDSCDVAAHGGLLAAMPGFSASFGARQRRGPPPGFLSLTMLVKGGRGFVLGPLGCSPVPRRRPGGGVGAAVRGDEYHGGGCGGGDREGGVGAGHGEGARAGAGAMNMTKHLWAGAVAAMVSSMLTFLWRVEGSCTINLSLLSVG